MGQIIIGIHGLANKPPKEELEEYWYKSIAEGLDNIGAKSEGINFKLVYWANYLYKYQLHREKGYEFDSYYNNEPYIKAKPNALEVHDDDWKDKFRAFTGNILGSGMDWAKRSFDFDGLANAVLKAKLKDLDFYYQGKNVITQEGQKQSAKDVFRAELTNVLLEHQNDQIMLIAHSMGSIIAYDVLRNLGRNSPGTKVDHFITIGSPLGLPHVKNQIVRDRESMGFAMAQEVRTPTVITKSWVNYSDPLDPVALDTCLSDDYGPNDNEVQVIDDIVINDYLSELENRNHHKSYGYLRTPEISKSISTFIG
ncbi:MAG: alpha/beta hydrolase [Gammaproteobacteria bacterium]|nr:alpha/beta hydrolase [Gammaproteobacteria bacterium]